MSGTAPPTQPADRTNPLLLLVFSSLVGMYCLWILLLPIFPSQDGPMHLFFTHVLASLLSHSSPVYEHYYNIRHILPPYSLYYYLLIAISRVVPLLWADKLVVALAVATVAFGVRYLCISLGRHGAAIAMLIFPILLNWPLFMGFVNFTLSLGMGAWALGIWERLEAAPTPRRRVLFALLLALMTLTHPVPVALVLIFCSGDLLLRFADSLRAGMEARNRVGNGARSLAAWRRSWSFDLLLLFAIGACCAAYISAFTVRSIALQTMPDQPVLLSLRWLVLEHGLLLFGGRSGIIRFYRISIYLTLFIPLFIAILQAVRRRPHGEARPLPRWLILALVLLIALPFIPSDFNHSHLFRDRLMLVAWIAALAAGSAAAHLQPRTARLLAAYGALAGVLVLPIISHNVRPFAQRVAEIERAPIGQHGPVGLVLPAELQTFRTLLFFDPYQWAGAHYARRSNGVLLNTPWLDLPIIPIGMKQGLLNGVIPSWPIEAYTYLRSDLLASAEVRQKVYSRADYVFLVDQTDRTPVSPLDPVLAADTRDTWTCEKQDWFLLCDRKPKQ